MHINTTEIQRRLPKWLASMAKHCIRLVLPSLLLARESININQSMCLVDSELRWVLSQLFCSQGEVLLASSQAGDTNKQKRLSGRKGIYILL